MTKRKQSENLAHRFVLERGECVEGQREAYDGCCIDFAGDLAYAKGGRLAYFETPWSAKWRHHAAAEFDGVIHCLWQDDPMPLATFMEQIGASTVEYPAETKAK